MVAFRLLTKPEKPFLDIFQADHEDRCPVCKPDLANCPQKLDNARTKALTGGPCPCDLFTSAESELMRLPDGPFWVALARAVRPEVPDRPYPQRERRAVARESYVDSTSAIIGSSSPTRPSSSEFEVDVNNVVDEDEHDARRAKPEELTVHLVLSFLQFALNLCLVQDTSGGREVRARVERRRAEASIAGVERAVIAEDDGGICSMDRQAYGWTMGHPYLALLEAKRSFKYIHFNERTKDYNLVVSDDTLAQCLGEAIVVWKANRRLLRDG